MNRLLLVFAILLALAAPSPAVGVTYFDESFETAVVPVDPNTPRNPNDNWFLKRSWSRNDTPGTPFEPPAGNVNLRSQDNCYFTTERAHTGSVSFKADYTQAYDPTLNTGVECSLWTGAPLLPGNLQEAWIRYWRYTENYGLIAGGGSNKNVYLYTNGFGTPNVYLGNYSNGNSPTLTAMTVQNSRDCYSTADSWDASHSYTADCNTTWEAFPNQGVPPAPPNTWECIEAHIKLNTYNSSTGVPDRNGLLETYHNGLLVMRAQNIALQPYGGGGNTQGVSLFQNLIFYRQGALVGAVLYYDDLAVGDQRIGCGGPAAAWTFQTDFETAVVPLDPNNFNLPGFFGAPSGWSLARNNSNRVPGTPFQGGPVPDECYFTTEQAHSGTKSLKIQYGQENPDPGWVGTGNPGGYAECSFCLGSDCNIPSLATGIPDTTEVWYRAWVRFHNYGINAAASGNKIVYFHTSGNTGSPNLLTQALGPGGSSATATRFGFAPQLPVDCGSPTDGGTSCEPAFCTPPQAGGNTTYVPGCNEGGWTSPNQGVAEAPQDTWMCFEAHYRMNSVTGGVANADALWEHWVDGVLTTKLSNFVMRPATVAPFASGLASADVRWRGFQIYRQGARVGSVMYWDDIAVSDQRIGCGGVITPPSPAAPSNLRLAQ